jgi:glycosyltransferase involved in cell wall biosynthesis
MWNALWGQASRSARFASPWMAIPGPAHTASLCGPPRVPEPIRVLYSTRVDVGAPTGPGVNEATFLLAMRDLAQAGDVTIESVVSPYRSMPHGTARIVKSVLDHFGTELIYGLRLVGRLRRSRPDVHVARVGPLPIGTALAVLLTHTPLALKTYSYIPDPRFRQVPGVGRATGAINAALHRFLLRRARVVDCVTSQIVELSRAMSSTTRFVVVDNGVDAVAFASASRFRAREELRIPQDAIVIAYIGREPTVRGGREVVETVAFLGLDTWGLVVGCTDEDERSIVAESIRAGVVERVRVMSVCPPDLVPHHMAAADIGLALDDPDRSAIYGNASQKVRQYLACGIVPVVIDGTNGFVLEAGLGRSVAKKQEVPTVVAEILQLPDYRNGELKRRARSYAEAELDQRRRARDRLELWKAAIGRPNSAKRVDRVS